MNRLGLGLAALTCAALLGVVAAAEAWSARTSAAAGATTSSACQMPARVAPRVLPVWARDGFSAPKPRMPYVVGRKGRIAAILWANPLQAPPPRDHNNKILWVSRAATLPGSDLRISAQLMSGLRPVGAPVIRRVTGGPGPSIIDLPSAGCWRLSLHWSHSTDTLDLRFAGNP